MQVLNKKYWPYQFRIVPETDAWAQKVKLEQFCYDNFATDWRNNGLYFCFKRQEDAVLFALQWA